LTQEEFNEFRQRVEMGEEFQVYHDGKEYWISQNVNGYYFTRVKDRFSQDFKSATDLLENATIDSKLIKHLWGEIEW
jgi:hypothetical protein